MHIPNPTIVLPLLSMTAVSAPLARKPDNLSVLSLRLIRIVGANFQRGIQLTGLVYIELEVRTSKGIRAGVGSRGWYPVRSIDRTNTATTNTQPPSLTLRNNMEKTT